MSETDKKIVESIAKGVKELDDVNKSYLLGIGEGIRLAKDSKKKEEKED